MSQSSPSSPSSSSSSPSSEEAPIHVMQRGNVVVFTFNTPHKLNCWNTTMLQRMKEVFAEASADATIRAIVLTGKGRYFSSGAAFNDLGIGLMRLSTLHTKIAQVNVEIFDPFIHSAKPIFVAANGPAVGGATTCMLLCDAVIAAPTATFHTPFVKLGITPEGCSTITFAAKMGQEAAARMLGGEKLDAREAKRVGFVDVLVSEDADVVERACAFAEEWLLAGKGRLTSAEQVEERDRVNKVEGMQLADALFSSRFLAAQGMNGVLAAVVSPALRLLSML